MQPFCEHTWLGPQTYDVNGWTKAKDWTCRQCDAHWVINSEGKLVVEAYIRYRDGERMNVPGNLRPDRPIGPTRQPRAMVPPDAGSAKIVVHSITERNLRLPCPREGQMAYVIERNRDYIVRNGVWQELRPLISQEVERSEAPEPVKTIIRDDGEWWYRKTGRRVEVFHRDGSEEDVAIWSYEVVDIDGWA